MSVGGALPAVFKDPVCPVMVLFSGFPVLVCTLCFVYRWCVVYRLCVMTGAYVGVVCNMVCVVSGILVCVCTWHV